MTTWVLRVACDVPVAVSADGLFDYAPNQITLADGEVLDEHTRDAWLGRAVIVPFGRPNKRGEVNTVVGWVFDTADATDVPADKLKAVLGVVPSVPRADATWLQLMRFMARYYQRGLGEVSLPALPKKLRQPAHFRQDEAGVWQLQQGKRTWQQWCKRVALDADLPAPIAFHAPLQLNTEQQSALNALLHTTQNPAESPTPQLLFGITGSGKTEVYLHYLAQILQADDSAQVLILVPEINLTPQFAQRLTERFGDEAVVSLHSGLNDGERLLAWWRAAYGHARVILGTRLSILAMIPNLRAIVVDEEHDPSYRQQDGIRYSARDVAIYRAHQLGIPIILGSATPSFETWHNAQSGRYGLHVLNQRANSGAQLPDVHLVNTQQRHAHDGLSQPMIQAVDAALARGQMSLLFQNRRGYAPVVYCTHCGWVADCTACSAHMVYHKSSRQLHCHHCGAHHAVPKQCPSCGNSEIIPIGHGTQRLEETIQARWPQARVLRLDADSTRNKGELERQLKQINDGEIDIVIGTQILAKGHDWPNLTVVGVLDADSGLFAQDYRAPEKLFAQLQQVIGRAGRGQYAGEVLIQSRFVEHPMWQHLLAHQFTHFAAEELVVRRQLSLPPFGAHALLQVGADAYADAHAFAHNARELALTIIAEQPEFASITVNAAVPMQMMRVKHSERAQVLIECTSRARLQAFLPLWQAQLIAQKSRLTWLIEIDPAEI